MQICAAKDVSQRVDIETMILFKESNVLPFIYTADFKKLVKAFNCFDLLSFLIASYSLKAFVLDTEYKQRIRYNENCK